MASKIVGSYAGTLMSSADEIFHGYDALDVDTVISPERALWIAVICRAWLDAFEASDAFLVQSERKNSDPDILRAEARRWLVLDHHKWKNDREEVCMLAGVDPNMIRDAARRRLKETKTEKANDLDRAFLVLVECSESLDASALDTALAALAALENEAA